MPKMRNQRGFTLLEVLVAITILAVIVMGMFSVYLHAIREIRRAKNRTFATNANQMILDRICAVPFDARRYNGADTSNIETLDANIKDDITDWAAMLRQFPYNAVGVITAQVQDRCVSGLAPPLCPKVILVIATIRYQDVGRERMQVASLYVEPRESL